MAYVVVYVRSGVPQADFVPFYCAGVVLNQHENPYLASPLGHCEAPIIGAAVIPAPLPPYVLGSFRIIALLPYDTAAALWRCLVIAAIAIAVISLRALLRLPSAVLCAAVLPIALRDTIPLGQPFPIVLAALAAAALAIDRGRDVMAGLLLSVTMMEPNVGLPACCAAFLFRPGCRLPLGLGALAAIAFTILAVPLSLTLMYFAQVIPAQATSEIGWFMQYSLTHVLFLAGVASHVALIVGSLWYIVMVVFGVVLAHRLVLHGCSPSVLALVPPSVAVLGGSYVHIWQIQVAVPAALLFVATERGLLRQLALLAAIAVSVPWIEIGFPGTAVVSVVAIFTMLCLLSGRLYFLAPLAAALAAVVAWKVTGIQPQMQPVSSGLPPLASDALAQVAWARYVENATPLHQGAALVLQAPTWAGLLLVVLLCVNHWTTGVSRTPRMPDVGATATLLP